MKMTYQIMHCTTNKCGSGRTIKGEAGHNKYQQKLCDECSEMYQQIYRNKIGKASNVLSLQKNCCTTGFRKKASQHKDMSECS